MNYLVCCHDNHIYNCPVGWGYRIYWLLLCRGVRPPPPNECPRYDTKQSDGEVPVMLELRGMQSTPSLLPGPLRPGVVTPDKGPIYGLNRTKSWFWQLNCVLTFKQRAYEKEIFWQTVYSCSTELFEIELFAWKLIWH